MSALVALASVDNFRKFIQRLAVVLVVLIDYGCTDTEIDFHRALLLARRLREGSHREDDQHQQYDQDSFHFYSDFTIYKFGGFVKLATQLYDFSMLKNSLNYSHPTENCLLYI